MSDTRVAVAEDYMEEVQEPEKVEIREPKNATPEEVEVLRESVDEARDQLKKHMNQSKGEGGFNIIEFVSSLGKGIGSFFTDVWNATGKKVISALRTKISQSVEMYRAKSDVSSYVRNIVPTLTLHLIQEAGRAMKKKILSIMSDGEHIESTKRIVLRYKTIGRAGNDLFLIDKNGSYYREGLTPEQVFMAVHDIPDLEIDIDGTLDKVAEDVKSILSN